MERTKVNKDDKIRWRKTGGGSFRMGSGKIIKPGQVFTARLDEIPVAFRDVIMPLDDKEIITETNAAVDVPKAPELEYTVRHKGGAWYDVVNKDGKVLNDKSLRKEAAEELVASLK